MWGILLITVVIFWIYWFLVATRHPKNFPPGPRFALPLIGDSLAIGNNLNEGFKKLQKTYGDAIGCWMGPIRTVVLNDYDTIVEATNMDVLSSRPIFVVPSLIRGAWDKTNCPGILFSNGQNWMEQRRFTLQNLRNMGFGKAGMEDIIAEDVKRLCQHFEKNNGQPIDVKNEFQVVILSALWQIMTNEQIEYDDPKMMNMFQLVNNVFQEGTNVMVILAMLYAPFGKVVQYLNLASFYQTLDVLLNFLDEKIKEHYNTYQEDNMRDFTDLYIREMKTGTKESFQGSQGEANFKNVLFDLFFAGSETTSTTLNWAVFYMATHPDVQAKVQEEIDRVTGRSRYLNLSDRSDTPYLEATIHEIQRLGNIIGFGVPHRADADCHLGSYFIPKGTQVMLNYGADTRNPDLFPNPDVCDPTRFLTQEGKFEANPRIVAFGLGKRRCLGETLARNGLYLFFGGLMAQFKITKAHPDDVLDPEPVLGATLSPKPYKVCFKSRN